MAVSEILDTVVAWCSANVPIVIGIGVALVIMVLTIFSGRRRGLAGGKFASSTANTLLAEKAANWAPPEQSYADRRTAIRREGPPVRVLLASPTFRNGVGEGYVLDRSTGGLRIAIADAVAPGSVLQVRAVNAPDNVGFVTILVRSCRPSNDFYELGCEFEATPPWSVLLLFG
ncbi:MAG: hypothetical protein C0467_19580 [Planctomycetaceae bacterium]|nr:hypothetical protein [Planctomycetaceae bacterium]